ncbi:CpsD/CapB family tyrosine-protein kinase [Lentibacillus sp. L22]|uniref:CpsD/CapB family tyrosine-protein kinase n=1 Tax=Lentibacillus sp. L22 TaxID=3163028 RepID=UPI003465D493
MRKKNQSKQSKTKQLIAQLSPRSPISEQYRTIRTNLQFSAIDEELQSMLITSSEPGEGKTMTTANLAVVYAQQGKKVLLIDADLRKPNMHYTFRVDNIKGLSNILVGDTTMEDAISITDVPDLDVITCGPIPPNPSELLSSKRMEQLVYRAKSAYDLIIFDTPPILAVADAKILANICDGAILVVRSKQTEYEAAAKAIELLKPAPAKMLGTILNDRSKKEDNYYYYYGEK